MKNKSWISLVFFLLVNSTAYAFDSADEQIDHYLEILQGGSHASKIEMLQRLQWSGLSDSRLYDAVEKQLLEQIENPGLDEKNYRVLPYNIRALGYSGNEKYRATLMHLKSEAEDKKFQKHASKALRQLDQYIEWNMLIEDSLLEVDGSSAEVGTYMKMLDVDNVYTQRLAARAIFHEKRTDPDLLALAAETLERLNSTQYLDKQEDDTGAWLCKALGQSGDPEYITLLASIANSTSHRKIKKYASQYASLGVSSSQWKSTTDTSVSPGSGSNITGTYVSDITTNKPTGFREKYRKMVLILEQKGDIISGTDSAGKASIQGTREGDTITFDFSHGNISWGHFYSGVWKINPDGIRLEGSYRSRSGRTRGRWNLTKIK